MFIKRKSANLFKKSAVLSLEELKRKFTAKPAEEESKKAAEPVKEAKQEVKPVAPKQPKTVKKEEKVEEPKAE